MRHGWRIESVLRGRTGLTGLGGPARCVDALQCRDRRRGIEPLRSVVQQDWTDATASEQRSAAVRVLAQKYTVKTAP